MASISIFPFPVHGVSQEIGPIGSASADQLPFNPVFPPIPDPAESPALSQHNISVLSPPGDDLSPVVPEGCKQKGVSSEVAQAKKPTRQCEHQRKKRQDPKFRAKEADYEREHLRKKRQDPKFRAKEAIRQRAYRQKLKQREGKEQELGAAAKVLPAIKALEAAEQRRYRSELKERGRAAAEVLAAIKTLEAAAKQQRLADAESLLAFARAN